MSHGREEVQYTDASNLVARSTLHARFSVSEQPFHQWVFDFIARHPTHKILEAGCGDGNLWYQNRTRIPEGWTVLLTDSSIGMLADARSRLATQSNRFNFEHVGVEDLPYPDGMFDTVVANHMLYHVPDLQAAIRQIKRVLKPTGRLYATTNGPQHMHELRELVAAHSNKSSTSPPHMRFGLHNGTDLLGQHFKHVDLYRYDSHLKITESLPLVDYVKSTVSMAGITESPVLNSELERHITSNGHFRVTQDTGIFVATNN